MYFQRKRKEKMMMNGQVGPRREKIEKAEDGPADYEGKEHVKYKNPGFSRHEIRIPEDEPHMKGHVSKEESHEAEDDYHMDVPDQTEMSLPKKIKRAYMKMDDPEHQKPQPLHGNLTTRVSERGLKDEDGWEDYGPEDMQEDSRDGSKSKSHRKKLAIAVIKRRIGKRE